MNSPTHPPRNRMHRITARTCRILLGLLYCAMISAVLFTNLGTNTVRSWDEAMLAQSALEMRDNGNWIVPYRDGTPDTYNIKPPMMLWLQILSMELFGFNEWALRLPAACAGFATVLVLVVFAWRVFGNLRWGLLSGFILISSLGYIKPHVVRTGDYDGLLTMWTTIMSLSFFAALTASNRRSQAFMLLLSAAAAAFAFLTKDVASLFLLPGMFLMLAATSRQNGLFSSKSFYAAILMYVLSVAAYAGAREWLAPGYVKMIIGVHIYNNMLVDGYNNAHPFAYYFRNIREGFFFWIALIPLGCVLAWLREDSRYRQLAAYIVVLLGSYLLILSSSITKYPWYDVQFYPLAALLVGQGLDYGLCRISGAAKLRSAMMRGAVYLTLFVAFLLVPYKSAMDRVLKEGRCGNYEASAPLCAYLRNEIHTGSKRLHGCAIIFEAPPGEERPIKVYQYILGRRGVRLGLKTTSELNVGDLIVVSQPEVKMKIQKKFIYITDELRDGVELNKLAGRIESR